VCAAKPAASLLMPVEQAYVSCFLYPVLGATDWPYFHGGPVAWRTHAAANM
jgi:hypothetical protein